MARSKLSTKAILLATGIGLSMAAFAGSQPAAAQSDIDEYACAAGTVDHDPYGCTVPDEAYEPYDYGGFLLHGVYRHDHDGHGFGHGMGGVFEHGAGFAHAGGFGGGHR